MRSRPFTILGASQSWRIKTTPDGGRVYYRACVIRFRDGRVASRYVRDDLVAAA